MTRAVGQLGSRRPVISVLIHGDAVFRSPRVSAVFRPVYQFLERSSNQLLAHLESGAAMWCGPPCARGAVCMVEAATCLAAPTPPHPTHTHAQLR